MSRDFTKEECMELVEMTKAVNAKRWEVQITSQNTAQIPGNAQRYVAQLEATARLLEQARDYFATSKLRECGFPDGRGQVDLATGKITPLNDGPQTNPKAPGKPRRARASDLHTNALPQA